MATYPLANRLAFSTNAFKKNTLDEAIDAIADIGYRGVEVMADLHHAYPPLMTEARTREIQERLARRGLVVSNINAFTLLADGDTYHPTWIESDAWLRQKRIAHTQRCVELAHRFGCKTVSLQPGGPLIGQTLSRPSASELFARGLAEIVPLARRLGVILAVEPEPGLLIESSREYLEFKEEFFPHEPAIAMNCDIGHLFCVGENPAEVIRAMPEQVAHVHLEDIGANHVHQHLTPGNGAIDFASIFAALRHIGFTGWVTVELYPYETTAAGVARAAWENLQPILSLGAAADRRV